MKTQTKIHKAAFGMAPYVAPELFNSQLPPYSKKTDIYSLGVLLWEISSGYPPFKNEDYSDILLIYNVANGTREKMIPDTPPDYHKLYTVGMKIPMRDLLLTKFMISWRVCYLKIMKILKL